MPRRLDNVAEWVRRRPALLGGARAVVRLIPDIAWTKRFPEIGSIRFRLRQQRWYLWEEFAKNDHFMLGVFHRLVRPGDVVYDVGANIGIYTRILVQWFQAGRVAAFEPMRQNVALLGANVTLGGLDDRVQVFAMALSDDDGEEDLQVDDVRSTTAVLDSVAGGRPSEGRRHFNLAPLTERVEVARLDRIVAEHDLAPPDVVKIDTEGAEARVIEGARATLKRHRPRLAVATHGGDRATETITALDAFGYACFGFLRSGGGPTYTRLTPDDGSRLHNNNLVASTCEEDVREPIVARGPAECR